VSEKILIVDDDPETIQFLNLILNRLGYTTLVARDGREALEMAQRELPDLVVLDVMMPDLDGFEVARILRRNSGTALTPILMFTAKTQVEDKLTGYDAGVDIYLTKPIHPVDLYANIKTLLTQRRSRSEIRQNKGHIAGVLSAKGGLGVSTIALNLAIAYHQNYQSKVIAAELRPGQGIWAEELNLAHPSGLSYLLRQNPLEITSSTVEKQLVSTSFGVPLLVASGHSEDVECMSSLAQFEVILNEISLMAPLVILDIGTNFHPAYNILIELCDQIVLLVEPQLVVAKRTKTIIEELEKQGFGGARALSVVMVNRTGSGINLNLSQIEEIIKHPVALGFPPAAELVHLSATRFMPLYLVQPGGILARQFDELAGVVAQYIR